MAHTFDTKVRIPVTALATSNAVVVTGTFACGANATLFTLGILKASSLPRLGAAPTYGGTTLTQANTSQGVTETAVELWYLLDPPVNQTLLISIPNDASALLIGYVSSYNAQTGYTSRFDNATGTATTSANPSVTLKTTNNGNVLIGIVGDGINN